MLYASLLASSAQENQYKQQHLQTPVCCKTQRLIPSYALDQRYVGLFGKSLTWSDIPHFLIRARSAQKSRWSWSRGGAAAETAGKLSWNVTPFQPRGSIKRVRLIEWRVPAHIIHDLKVCWPVQRTRVYQRHVHGVNREDKHLRLQLSLTARQILPLSFDQLPLLTAPVSFDFSHVCCTRAELAPASLFPHILSYSLFSFFMPKKARVSRQQLRLTCVDLLGFHLCGILFRLDGWCLKYIAVKHLYYLSRLDMDPALYGTAGGVFVGSAAAGRGVLFFFLALPCCNLPIFNCLFSQLERLSPH